MNPAPANNSNTLADILQMYGPNLQTGQITYYTNATAGYVYLQHGQVIHAVVNDLEGEDAVHDMLKWDFGSYTFDEGILPHKRTILKSLDEMLFDCAQRADLEQQGLPPTGTQPVPSARSAGLASSRTQGGVPRLTLIDGQLPDQSHELADDEYYYVGRTDDNSIVLPVASVSSKHCMLIKNGSDILIRDLNSSNGTYVNGEPITEVILKIGDIVQIGDITFRFESAIKRPKLTAKTGTISATSKALQKETAPIQVRAGKLSNLSLDRPLTYQAVAPEPEPRKKNSALLLMILGFLGACAAAYYFLFMPH